MKAQIIFISIDTTGLPIKNNKEYYNPSDLVKYDCSRIVKISWEIYDLSKKKISTNNFVVKAEDFTIKNSPYHSITPEISSNEGIPIRHILDKLEEDIDLSKLIVSHCYEFCKKVLQSEAYRSGKLNLVKKLETKDNICTGLSNVNTLKLQFDKSYSSGYKIPRLDELYFYCFKKPLEVKHDSSYNVEIISKCFFSLVK